MRKNEPTLAIGGVDTAEKEPPKDTEILRYRPRYRDTDIPGPPPTWIKSTALDAMIGTDREVVQTRVDAEELLAL